MKHCANPECPHRLSTGSAAEYRDGIETCANCRSVLTDGPAPQVHERPPLDEDTPVTIATFSNQHEAHLARAALESHGIEAFVQHDHSQYTTAAPWLHLQVARRDSILAATVLERGPVQTAEPPGTPAADRTDDLRALRLQRRLMLGRWILYAQAVSALPLLLILVPLFVVPAGLALWSRLDPRRAFAVALGLQTVVGLVAVATLGPVGMGLLIPLLAFYFAWEAAAPNPPESLLEGPATPTIDIGDAWQVPIAEPPERPIGLARPLAVVAVLVTVLWGGWLAFRSPRVHAVFGGTTEVALEAHRDSALFQALRLGQARLAHQLHSRDVRYDAIQLSERDTLEITGIDRARTSEVKAVVERLFPAWTVEEVPAGGLRVAMSPQEKELIIAEALDDVQAELRRDFGATSVAVEQGHGDRLNIRAHLLGEWTAAKTRETFGKPLTLEFSEVVYPENANPSWMPPGSPDETVALFGGRLPPGTELVQQQLDGSAFVPHWPLRTTPVIVGRDLVEANPTTDEQGSPALGFRLSEEAGPRLEAATRRMVGRKMALVLRGEEGARVVSVPVIRGVIATQGIIQGSFTVREVNSLALQLRAGSRALWLTPAGLN